MALQDDFRTFVDAASEDDRARLGCGLSVAVSLVAKADGKVSLSERMRGMTVLARGDATFGDTFTKKVLKAGVPREEALRRKIEGLHRDFRSVVARVEKGEVPSAQDVARAKAYPRTVEGLYAQEMAAAKKVIKHMPASIRPAFEDFVARVIVSVADVSGGVSEQERKVARASIAALGVEVREPSIRKKLGM